MRGLLRLGGAQSSSIETNAGWRRLVRWLPWPAVRLCGTALGCRAVPTRRKPVPGGSRSPSMATRRSAQPCTPAPSAIPSGYWKKPRVVALSHSKPPAVALGCPCHDRLMPWSEIAPAFPTLPPSLAVGWHQRAPRDGFTACRSRGIPMQRPALTNSHLEHRDHKKIAHGTNRWAIKEPALDPGRTAHFQALHVQNHQVVDHRRAFLPYHMDVALQHHLGAAGQHFHRLDPSA